jgi:hypothetical protein
MSEPTLRIVPITFRDAAEFVARFHRHHEPPRGAKFSLGVETEDGELHGVIIVGRPIARAFDDRQTAEVTRSCTDGTKNANSCLYAAAWRVCRAMGYARLITYTQEGETGVSLKAAGWKVVAQREARKSWKESSVKLAALRDPIGNGGIARTLWEVA